MYFLLNLPNYLLLLKTEIKLPQLSAMGVLLYCNVYLSSSRLPAILWIF